MAEIDLDDTDFKILQELDRNGEVDVDELSDELDVSPSTVYYRLDKYREKDILRGTVADLNARKLGFNITAITEIKSDYGPEYDEIGDQLSELSGVEQVYFMLGEMSFVVISKVPNQEQLQGLIDEIIHTDGVVDSSTHVVLKTFKDEPRLLVNYDNGDLEKIFG